MLCQALLRARQAVGNRFAPQSGRFHHRSITTPGTAIHPLGTIFTVIPTKKHTTQVYNNRIHRHHTKVVFPIQTINLTN